MLGRHPHLGQDEGEQAGGVLIRAHHEGAEIHKYSHGKRRPLPTTSYLCHRVGGAVWRSGCLPPAAVTPSMPFAVSEGGILNFLRVTIRVAIEGMNSGD